jgi:hypothetical protein
MTLQISVSDLLQRFESYLSDGGHHDAARLADKVVRRLCARDAILVQYGTDSGGQEMFGFVHRSFQEYFASCWMARELDESEFRQQLFAGRAGWDETLYLAVAQVPDKQRRKILLELVMAGRAEFAVNCMRAAAPEELWLQWLVRFLAGWYWHSVVDCADTCGGRPETLTVLQAMFVRQNRWGPSLPAAVELAEELASRGNAAAGALVAEFFSEAEKFPEEMVEIPEGKFPYGEDNQQIHIPSFFLDRFPVTNQEYERMVPSHKRLRDQYSETDRHPVIYVNWFEARLYARWRGRGCRLPTEKEWEKAASWDLNTRQKRVFPWGNEFDSSRCKL